MPHEEEVAYHPDMKEDDSKNGLVCFMSATRPCGADCMAFSAEQPEGHEYIGQWSNCRLLTSMHKGAKHLTILATVGSQLIKHQADETRRSQPAPPVPQGPPR